MQIAITKEQPLNEVRETLEKLGYKRESFCPYDVLTVVTYLDGSYCEFGFKSDYNATLEDLKAQESASDQSHH